MAVVSLDKDFGYVVMAGSLIGLQILVHGFRFPGTTRRKVFDREFFDSAKKAGLLDEHKKATGSDRLPEGAYPDMGNGRFSSLLPYAKWLAFNNAQRAHYNYVEGISSVMTFLVFGGLFFPRFAAATAGVYLLGRELYSYGYTSSGPKGRVAGAVLLDLSLLVLFGAAMTGGAKLLGWV